MIHPNEAAIPTRCSGRGAARAENAQGTPIQSHISPRILVYEDKRAREVHSGGLAAGSSIRGFISQNVSINKFEKVNSPKTSSTRCLLLLIKIISSGQGPLSSERGTNQLFRARFWPWLAPFSMAKSFHPFKLFLPPGEVVKPRVVV